MSGIVPLRRNEAVLNPMFRPWTPTNQVSTIAATRYQGRSLFREFEAEGGTGESTVSADV